MAITISLVQQTATASSTPTVTRTLNGVAQGDLLVMQFDCGSSSVAAITVLDNNGNLWQIAESLTFNDGSFHTIGIAYASNVNAGNTTVTITNSVSQPITVNLAEYSQTGIVGGYLALDQVNSNTANSTSPNSGNVTTSISPNELLIGMIKNDAGSLIVGVGWTENTNFLGTIMPEYQIVTSTGTYAATATSASGTWGACIATFFVFIPAFNTLAGRFNGAGKLVGNLIVPIWTAANVTPVTVASSINTDQNLMSQVIPANTLNSVGRTLRVRLSGVYSLPLSNSPTDLTFKIKLGSLTLIDIVTTAASASAGITNNKWILECDITTQTAGSSAVFEASAGLTVDLGALDSSANTVFMDINATTIGTLDSTADQTLQNTLAFSTSTTSNVGVQRQMVLNTIN
jgi:hypothetical protein